MKISNLILFCLLNLIDFSQCQAQLGQTPEMVIESIEKNNWKYERGKIDGVQFIEVLIPKYDKKIGNYTRKNFMAFKELDVIRCTVYMITNPQELTNDMVKDFNERFVKIGYMKWKDYQEHTVYDMEIENGKSVTTVYYDFTEPNQTNNTTNRVLFEVKNEKSYFHNTPSHNSRRAAYLVNGEVVRKLREENGFIYIEFLNPKGQKSVGWILKSTLK